MLLNDRRFQIDPVHIRHVKAPDHNVGQFRRHSFRLSVAFPVVCFRRLMPGSEFFQAFGQLTVDQGDEVRRLRVDLMKSVILICFSYLFDEMVFVD